MMTNYARVIHGVAVNVSTDPENEFHPELAVEFVPVPDDVECGWLQNVDGDWSAPDVIPVTPDTPKYPQVSPVEFKLLFTSQERVAIHNARATDFAVDDFFGILDDPRLQYVDLNLASTQDALNYFASTGLIDAARIPQILSGVIR